MTQKRACVLGATGIVGQHFIRILENHPDFEVVGLTASEKSVGKTYSGAADWLVSPKIPADTKDMIIKESSTKAVSSMDADIAFCALPRQIAGPLEAALADHGIHVFTNAGAHRMDKTVPILIPEVNANHLSLVENQDYDGFIVTNSNCSTSGLALALAPIRKWNIKSVFVTTQQAVSGAGRHGVSSMDILGNIIPYIAEEEEKMASETKKILGDLCDGSIRPASFEIHATCTRVPVLEGHLESVSVRLESEFELSEIAGAFRKFKGEPQVLSLPTAPKQPILLHHESDRPQPRLDLGIETEIRAMGMPVSIGRLRKKDDVLSFVLLVHNTIRGAAGASVLNAELAKAKGIS